MMPLSVTPGQALQRAYHAACGARDGSSRCSSSADICEVVASGRLQSQALWAAQEADRGARRPQPAGQGPRSNLSPPARMINTVKCRRPDHHLAATPGPEDKLSTSLRSGPRVAALLLPASPSFVISSHIHSMHLVGSGAVGVRAGRALQCLIGHIRLRRSLNIVQARVQARSRSSE